VGHNIHDRIYSDKEQEYYKAQCLEDYLQFEIEHNLLDVIKSEELKLMIDDLIAYEEPYKEDEFTQDEERYWRCSYAYELSCAEFEAAYNGGFPGDFDDFEEGQYFFEQIENEKTKNELDIISKTLYPLIF